MSRPEIPIDWKLVDKLLVSGCLGTEVAANFNIHADTLYRRIEEKYGIGFTAYAQEKYARGESILRDVQFELASKNKDKTMLIWLGKQRLKQREPDAPTPQAQNKCAFNEWKEEQQAKDKPE